MELPGKVLVVEDEHMIAYMLQDMIESLGPEVEHAATLADARRLLADSDFDFAFLDINLGEENTLSLARELENRGINYVFASGYDSKYEASDVSAPLLRKPLGIEEIKAAFSGDRTSAKMARIGRIG